MAFLGEIALWMNETREPNFGFQILDCRLKPNVRAMGTSICNLKSSI